jgi:hypothetical protein
MTLHSEVEVVPITQAGEQCNAPAETATNRCQYCDEPVAAQDQSEDVADAPIHKACVEELGDKYSEPDPEPEVSAPSAPATSPEIPEHESQEYEDALTERIRQNAPQYLEKSKIAKTALGDLKDAKEELAYQLACWKAIKVGKGRDGEWGPFLKDLRLARSTVDRWVERKFLNGELPQWASTKLAANKRADDTDDADPQDNQDGQQDHVETEEVEVKASVRFTENRLECVFPFTADEKAEFVKCFEFIKTADEAKQIFIEAMLKEAEVRREQWERRRSEIFGGSKSLDFLDRAAAGDEPVDSRSAEEPNRTQMTASELGALVQHSRELKQQAETGAAL